MADTTVLITGATGFIGQHLLEDILPGSVTIRALTRRKEPLFRAQQHKIEVFPGDLGDKESVDRAVNGADIIVNLAAELRSKESFDKTNITGVRNLAEAASRYNVKKIVHLSSVGVVGMQYSPAPVNVNESSSCHPKNDYERTKLESERILLEHHKRSGIPLVILRPTNVFGDEHPRKALLNFFSRCRQQKKFYFTQGAMLNYVYVKDLTNAVHHFMLNTPKEIVYNVGEAMSFDEFYKAACQALKVNSNKIVLPSFIADWMHSIGYMGLSRIKHGLQVISNRVTYDDSRLVSALPYKYGARQGVAKTIDHYLLTKQL